MKQWLEKHFKLSEYHTDVKTELIAGLTTFVTMAYVLATVPNMLASAGLDKHVMFTVLILLVTDDLRHGFLYEQAFRACAGTRKCGDRHCDDRK